MLIISKTIGFRNYIWGVKSIAFESLYHFLQESGRVTSNQGSESQIGTVNTQYCAPSTDDTQYYSLTTTSVATMESVSSLPMFHCPLSSSSSVNFQGIRHFSSQAKPFFWFSPVFSVVLAAAVDIFCIVLLTCVVFYSRHFL
ncbi:unnamed protein product [Callosobruchus maculatus]|uniref:Uncharacterized protein n=1 Tax=Callosobruchus maculatus TaxID=64391 RepID=A0A653CG56_CALMS|nr:unnamed protein product [Callosobruchus maculatus]